MTLVRVLAKRLAMGVVAAWAVLTAVWALFTLTPDWVLQGQVGAARWGDASGAEVEQLREGYLAARGLDRPLLDQYLDWMGNMVTLEWGQSLETGDPVLPTVLEAATRTAAYVLPAIGLAITIGVLVGLYAAMHPDSRLARGTTLSTYLLFALPNFWLGGMLLSLAYGGVVDYSPLVYEWLLPVWLTTTTLLGGYVSYSRATSLEYAAAEFVTLVEAKGARSRRVARHVLRNAAIPVFSMLFTEALGLLVLSVFVVEVLFGIDGFGLVLFEAIDSRDLPVLLGGTLVVIGVGVLGNVVQDLSYRTLDPRVDTGER